MTVTCLPPLPATSGDGDSVMEGEGERGEIAKRALPPDISPEFDLRTKKLKSCDNQ